MLSRIYKGTVSHHRAEPSHHFEYPVWYLLIHLDEIDTICKLSPFVSFDRANLLSFYRQDYMPGTGSLKQAIAAKIMEETGRRFRGSIYLLTTLKQLGVSMNPISLFYCFTSDDSETPEHIVAEVHNTPWNERFCYVISSERSQPRNQVVNATHSKAFHVSPFMPMNTQYHWSITPLRDTHDVNLSVSLSSKTIFSANLRLVAQPLTRLSLHREMIRHGWRSIAVIRRIYWQAFRLFMKRATFYPHPIVSAGGEIDES